MRDVRGDSTVVLCGVFFQLYGLVPSNKAVHLYVVSLA